MLRTFSICAIILSNLVLTKLEKAIISKKGLVALKNSKIFGLIQYSSYLQTQLGCWQQFELIYAGSNSKRIQSIEQLGMFLMQSNSSVFLMSTYVIMVFSRSITSEYLFLYLTCGTKQSLCELNLSADSIICSRLGLSQLSSTCIIWHFITNMPCMVLKYWEQSI